MLWFENSQNKAFFPPNNDLRIFIMRFGSVTSSLLYAFKRQLSIFYDCTTYTFSLLGVEHRYHRSVLPECVGNAEIWNLWYIILLLLSCRAIHNVNFLSYKLVSYGDWCVSAATIWDVTWAQPIISHKKRVT